MTTDTNNLPYRTDTVNTVHTLTRDVVNAFAPFADKRLREEFLHLPILEAGWRVLVKRDYTFNSDRWKPEEERTGKPPRLEYCVAELRILKPNHRGRFCWREYRILTEQSVTIEIGDRAQAESTAERRRGEAYKQLGTLLLASLSAPVEDFDALFQVDRSPDEEDTLRQLWRSGVVNIEQIKAARQGVRDQWDRDAEAEEKADG